MSSHNSLPRYNRQQGLSILEVMLVAVIISVLFVVALYFLQKRVEQAEQAALSTMSKNFASSMAMLRNKWIVEGRRINHQGYGLVKLDQDDVYVNGNGWPVATTPIEGATQTAEACLQLWQVMMQNSVAASTEGLQPRGSETYHISVHNNVSCRYELARYPAQSFYFDYNVENGKVKLHMQAPPVDKNNL